MTLNLPPLSLPPIQLDIIKTNYSYHEKSEPDAPSPLRPADLFSEDGGVGGGDGGGGGGGRGDPLSAVGDALGGAFGVVRSGFGIGRLFGRREMPSPAEEVAEAIGSGGVGFAGKVVAAEVASDAAETKAGGGLSLIHI